jgi:hypothetical protein
MHYCVLPRRRRRRIPRAILLLFPCVFSTYDVCPGLARSGLLLQGHVRACHHPTSCRSRGFRYGTWRKEQRRLSIITSIAREKRITMHERRVVDRYPIPFRSSVVSERGPGREKSPQIAQLAHQSTLQSLFSFIQFPSDKSDPPSQQLSSLA